MYILALDIDDCVFPSNNTYIGRMKDAHKILKLNMKRIKMMIEKYNMKVFITSSWFSILILEDGKIEYKQKESYIADKKYYRDEYKAFKIIKKVLDGNIIGMSSGCRYTDISILLNEGRVVVAIDDMDLSPVKISKFGGHVEGGLLRGNYCFIETTGFLTNRHTYDIDKFMRNHDYLPK
jgi:hypothetical protein